MNDFADFAAYCAEVYDNRKCATCRHCGKGIYQLYPDRPGDPWFHDAGNRRGCRAASYDGKGRHDESLDRKWSARP